MREISESRFMELPLLSSFSSLFQVCYAPSKGQAGHRFLIRLCCHEATSWHGCWIWGQVRSLWNAGCFKPIFRLLWVKISRNGVRCLWLHTYLMQLRRWISFNMSLVCEKCRGQDSPFPHLSLLFLSWVLFRWVTEKRAERKYSLKKNQTGLVPWSLFNK